MKRSSLPLLALLVLPGSVLAQQRMAATYITAEQVQTVNAQTGTDRQIVSVDIGKLNLAVGVIHRGATNAPAAAAGRAAGAAAGAAAGGGAAGRAAAAGGAAAGRGAAAGGGGGAAGGRAGGAAAPAAAPVACGVQGTAPANPVSGIAHDHQTETYVIISGGGTLVTGGQIMNGTKSAPESAVTTTLNGPSCSGAIVGNDVVRKVVKVGDIIVIPANVPHGWTDIGDHVDYLSVRPDPDRVLPAGYVHPSIKTP